MAIVFENESTCPICNKPLSNDRPYTLFPNMISNTKDSLFIFSDEGVHNDCLAFHPMGEKAKDISEKLQFYTSPENRFCKIGGNLVTKPENYFFIGLLTSNEKEKLFDYNFMTFDKENIKRWSKREYFLNLLGHFRENNKWENFDNFDYLRHIEKIIIENS